MWISRRCVLLCGSSSRGSESSCLNLTTFQSRIMESVCTADGSRTNKWCLIWTRIVDTIFQPTIPAEGLFLRLHVLLLICCFTPAGDLFYVSSLLFSCKHQKSVRGLPVGPLCQFINRIPQKQVSCPSELEQMRATHYTAPRRVFCRPVSMALICVT